MSSNLNEETIQEQLAAEALQKAYIAHRSAGGSFKQLSPAWNEIGPWVSLVRKASSRGVAGGEAILACLLTANENRAIMLPEIDCLMDSPAFLPVSRIISLLPGEADEMRELGMDPGDPAKVQEFRVRDYIKGALRKIAGVAETTDTNARIFVHYLVNDITATPPWLRYLLGWKHPEVDRECGEEARKFFKEKRHIAKACVALGWPKEIIAPDFEP